MPIKGITGHYRPQRQGKIHLGIKKTKQKQGGGTVEYPAEVDYFVLHDAKELIPIYTEQPKELHITLPSARFDQDFDAYLEKVIPQYLKRYTASGLHCKGDGEQALEVNKDTGTLEERECPCEALESGDCRRIGIFRFRIQEIPSFNIYQITTGSYNSIVNINSFVRDLLEHCIVNRTDPASIKLTLRREEAEVQRQDGGKVTKSRHHIMVVDLDARFYKSLDEIRGTPLEAARGYKELPPPDESKDELFYPQIQAGRPPTKEEIDQRARDVEAAAEAARKTQMSRQGAWEPAETTEPKKEAEKEMRNGPDPKNPDGVENGLPYKEDQDPKLVAEQAEELRNLTEQFFSLGGKFSIDFQDWVAGLPKKKSVMAYQQTTGKIREQITELEKKIPEKK